jgi:hypothetical protein
MAFSTKKAYPTTEYKAPAQLPKDLNTMDVDCLMTQQRKDHIERGLCFVCHLPGHTSRAHKGGRNTSSSNKPKCFIPQKKQGGYVRIKALMAELGEEEREETLQELEQKGF